MSRELKSLQMANEHLALRSASQRVGCLLLQMCSGMLGEGGTFDFRVRSPNSKTGRFRQSTGSDDRKLCRARRILLRRLLCDAGRVPRLAFVMRQQNLLGKNNFELITDPLVGKKQRHFAPLQH